VRDPLFLCSCRKGNEDKAVTADKEGGGRRREEEGGGGRKKEKEEGALRLWFSSGRSVVSLV